jgi:glycosyltransferase involved in cell wall biosynthesis
VVTARVRIDCIAVCIDYDDVLALTIDRYRQTFDEIVVVTTASDQRTIALCEQAAVRCVLSTRVHHRGIDFNLPALINDGYAALEPTDWVCKIDPDIHLPADARSQLERCLTDPDVLWGSRRYFCDTRGRFEEFSMNGDLGLLEPPYDEAGEDVVGFLQLFNARSRYLAGRRTPYEEEHYAPPSLTNDRLFSGLWPRERRSWLPFDVVHLGMDAIGTNWKGRKSPRFGS